MIPTYVLIGAGGTGSILFQPLSRYLSAHHRNKGDDTWVLAVIDGDELAAHNLDRQLFAPNYIDENKAVALVGTYGGDAVPVPEFLTDENIAKRINDGDVVIIAADNYKVRERIERHARNLDNIVVINGGNEMYNGSVQLYVRKDGQDVTPRLSWMHDEILSGTEDPAALDCIARAQLPGGGQTIVANMMAATQVLNVLDQYLTGRDINWHEVQFDLNTGNARSYDWRTVEGWQS
jgi:molybdopterin/thiamine biosynthesis adenylyltransferase